MHQIGKNNSNDEKKNEKNGSCPTLTCPTHTMYLNVTQTRYVYILLRYILSVYLTSCFITIRLQQILLVLGHCTKNVFTLTAT